ncbi:MAG: BTAD domain-containing putative transcriptional regulator [Acidimicrobiales bacterium]|jgi:predicted ATPase/DNA-binding SARP family transcriptional activator
MARLWFGLLGPTAVVGEGGEIPIHGALRRRLLVRLLIVPNRPVLVERLREDLWEGEPPASADSTLKSHISLLRRSIGPDRLSHSAGAYLLRVAPDEVDVTQFEGDAARGLDLLRDGRARDAASVLRQGLDRWRGRALGDAADTSWGGPECVRLEELRAAVLEAWLDARLTLGESGEVVAEAEAAVAEHPLREGLWAKLISALYVSGRQADALRAYQRLRELLGEELGIAPSRELVALESAILRQDLVSVRAASPNRRPPARPPASLPPELTSFVSRPNEEAHLAGLLARGGLVTLTGAGGTGKTRLAVRMAREAEASYDGVWFCDLAPLDDASRIAAEVASIVGCVEQAGIDLSETVSQRLAEGANLLVLDNCEQVLDAAAALALRLIKTAPDLRLIVTSRSPLGVAGEAVFRVPSMSVPVEVDDVDRVLAFESVRLFVERAESQQPTFSLSRDNCTAVVAVCARLDGIPLALELAAARLRTMTVTDIERRLNDRFELLTVGLRGAPARQQTLRSLIDWSYDLMDAPERFALRRLAVFAGGFDLAGAEAVVVFDGPSSVFDVVGSLVDKSLLQADTTGVTARYRMLETVREYAAAKLSSIEEQDARAAHARYFVELAETAAPHFSGSGQTEWRRRLEPDDDNLHLAFGTLLGAPDPSEALRFGAAVSKFWNSRGLYGDEMDLLEAALDHVGAADPTPARGAVLTAAGYLLFRRGVTARAQLRLDEALRIGRAIGSASLCADALRTMAWVADRRGDRAASVALAAEAVSEALSSAENHLIARAYDVRAAATQHDDPDGARSDYAEALKYCGSAGDGLGEASTLNNLAILELEQGNHQTARAYFNEAIAICSGVRDVALAPFLDYGVGLAATLDDDFEASEPAFAAALHGARRTGQRSLVAYALLGIGVTRAHTGTAVDAANLIGASSAMFVELGEQPEPIEAALRQGALASLRSHLGGELDRAVSAGGRLKAADIVRLATKAL